MGVPSRRNLGFPDTRISSEDADGTRDVACCIREERPDVLLIPSADDPHPDHASGGRLIERAVYFAGVPGYDGESGAFRPAHVLVYAGRNDLDPHVVVDVSGVFERKREAILAHRSQFVLEPGRTRTPLNDPEFLDYLEARARIHGRRIGARFGEPFHVTGPIGLADFRIFEG